MRKQTIISDMDDDLRRACGIDPNTLAATEMQQQYDSLSGDESMNNKIATKLGNMSTKQKIIAALIAAAVIIAAIAGFFCYYFSAGATQARQERAERKWSEANVESVTEQAVAALEKKGIDIDLVCTYVTRYSAAFSSEGFADLSPEEKKEAFTVLSIKYFDTSDGDQVSFLTIL